MQKSFICVSGNIGCGKTTVANLICNIFGFRKFEESVDDNPYLKLFYENMNEWSYKLQRYFLFSRAITHEKIVMAPHSAVQDRSIYEDIEIFAKNQSKNALWTETEYTRYLKFCEMLMEELKPPDLIVYLHASVPALRERIRTRARDYEAALTRDDDVYLVQLQELYESWIKNFRLSKKLIINTDNMNLVKNPDDITKLVESVRAALEKNAPLSMFVE